MTHNPMLEVDRTRDHYVTLTDDTGIAVRFHLTGTATGRALCLDTVQVEQGSPGLYFESGNLLEMLSEDTLDDLVAAAGYPLRLDPYVNRTRRTGLPPGNALEDFDAT